MSKNLRSPKIWIQRLSKNIFGEFTLRLYIGPQNFANLKSVIAERFCSSDRAAALISQSSIDRWVLPVLCSQSYRVRGPSVPSALSVCSTLTPVRRLAGVPNGAPPPLRRCAAVTVSLTAANAIWRWRAVNFRNSSQFTRMDRVVSTGRVVITFG